MEKKGVRMATNSSRGSSGTDLKKSIDASNAKQGIRAAARRREPPSGFSKATEANRKPQPQRNAKASDKRPKPRGFYYTGALPRSEETSLEEFGEPEWGSVFSPGSKKQSLNHLLNFSFAPRENYQNNYQPEKSAGNRQSGKWLVTKKHKYNKEHFLQANCQFVVNDKGDYTEYLNNPDALVDWDSIEQVHVQVNEEPACPICLYPPVAAKMTKCGHIYCWPCILHYLALSDKQWRKCPICYDAVKKDDLKSVITIPHKTFVVNDIITFKLMKRERGSLTAYPADAPVQVKNMLYNVSDKNKDNCFSKLFLANADNILDILDRESNELDFLIAEDEDCPERCFIEEAKQILLGRKKCVLDNYLKSEDVNKHNLIQNIFETDLDTTETVTNGCSESSFSEAEGGPHVAKYHYFYQAEDGQHIYLHAINAKMIEHSYGSLELGPRTLKGRILEKEGGSMTEELRKKLRYLQHLPVTCQFEVAEIALNQTAVNKETLEHFREQIEIRKKRRQRRTKEEKRREKRIEVEENKKIGKYDPPNLHLESRDHFPDVNESHVMFPEFLDHRQRTESESTLVTPSERSLSPDLSLSVSSMSLENTYVGPSFASMLAKEKKPSWPSLKKDKTNNPPSPTVLKHTTVSGSEVSNVKPNIRRRNSDLDQKDIEPVPDFSLTFGDALADALSKGLEGDCDIGHDSALSTRKKKKKKNKEKLLFSTHMTLPGI